MLCEERISRNRQGPPRLERTLRFHWRNAASGGGRRGNAAEGNWRGAEELVLGFRVHGPEPLEFSRHQPSVGDDPAKKSPAMSSISRTSCSQRSPQTRWRFASRRVARFFQIATTVRCTSRLTKAVSFCRNSRGHAFGIKT